MIDQGFGADEVQKMLSQCDLVYVCLYPQATLDFLRDNKDAFKSGAIVSDISGVKGIFEKSLPSILRSDVDFIIGHPMAGGEKEMRTPMQEVCETMNWCIEQGYALYWGTSEWTACQIMQAYDICDQLKLIRPVVEQCQYNLFCRDKMENEYRDLFKKYKMGTTIFSPLKCGVLTGKYIDQIPEDSRMNSKNEENKKKMERNDYWKNKKEYDRSEEHTSELQSR